MSSFIPKPAHSASRPAIVHPTGANAPDFSKEERLDQVSKHLAIGLIIWLERDNKTPNHNNVNHDEKTSLIQLENKLKKAVKRNASLFQTDNATTRLVIQWARKGRNSGCHNNLILLDSHEHSYLSAISMLMGPQMCDYPAAHDAAVKALSDCGLLPMAVLPAKPI